MKRNLRVALVALAAVAAAAGGAVIACGGDTTDRSPDASHTPSVAGGDASIDGALPATGDAGADRALPVGTCLRDEDCTGESYCLFVVGAACGSIGTCMSVPDNGPGCADAGFLDPTQETSCSCDGTPRYQPCALPAGYTRGDIVHPGPCADGGQVCDPEARNCPDQQICGFRVADGCGVTTAHCFDGPDPTIGAPGVLLDVCGCDGGMGSTFPDTDLYVSVPVPGLDSCRIVDAGPDAAADASDAADAD
jgi:hypothetical protein